MNRLLKHNYSKFFLYASLLATLALVILELVDMVYALDSGIDSSRSSGWYIFLLMFMIFSLFVNSLIGTLIQITLAIKKRSFRPVALILIYVICLVIFAITLVIDRKPINDDTLEDSYCYTLDKRIVCEQ